VVDPFRTDRWDYVYLYYKAGKLTEQKRITLFFEGDTLARIEGDLPEPAPQPAPAAAEPRTEPQPEPATSAATAPLETPRAAEPVPPQAASAAEPEPAPQPEPATPVVVPPAAAQPASKPVPQSESVVQPVPVAPQPAQVAVDSAPVAVAPAKPAVARTEPASRPAVPETSVVAPLPSPKNAPAYAGQRPASELGLQAETDVAKIQPDVIPPFPVAAAEPAGSDAPVLKTVNEWAAAWARRDKAAYFAAYGDRFVPQDGVSRAEWEERKRKALDKAKTIEIRIDSPRVARTEEGTVTVTFNQFYRADSYRDAVVKQLDLVEQDGRWLIIEEKVLSVLRGSRP
jgi:outer membrane protein assembly factor BamE